MTERIDTVAQLRSELDALRAELDQLREGASGSAPGDLVAPSIRTERLVIVDPAGNERIIASASDAPGDDGAVLRVQDPSGRHHVALCSAADDGGAGWWSDLSLFADGGEAGSFSVGPSPTETERTASIWLGDIIGAARSQVATETWVAAGSPASSGSKRRPLARRAPSVPGVDGPPSVDGRLLAEVAELKAVVAGLFNGDAELTVRRLAVVDAAGSERIMTDVSDRYAELRVTNSAPGRLEASSVMAVDGGPETAGARGDVFVSGCGHIRCHLQSETIPGGWSSSLYVDESDTGDATVPAGGAPATVMGEPGHGDREVADVGPASQLAVRGAELADEMVALLETAGSLSSRVRDHLTAVEAHRSPAGESDAAAWGAWTGEAALIECIGLLEAYIDRMLLQADDLEELVERRRRVTAAVDQIGAAPSAPSTQS